MEAGEEGRPGLRARSEDVVAMVVDHWVWNLYTLHINQNNDLTRRTRGTCAPAFAGRHRALWGPFGLECRNPARRRHDEGEGETHSTGDGPFGARAYTL